MTTVSLAGSTGSIGTQAMDVVLVMLDADQPAPVRARQAVERRAGKKPEIS